MLRRKNLGKIEWREAPDVNVRIRRLQKRLSLDWINLLNITCFRSENAKTRAVARIWGLGKVWQLALSRSPHYIIEVIAEKYDQLCDREKDEVLLHEITHIPKNFSGALVPHIRHRRNNFNDKVKRLVSILNGLK